jgi:hypothetical protein
MRPKEKNRRRRFRENGILAVYLLRFFWFLATAKGLISWLMALWLCASSGSLPGLAGSVFPFSRRGRGLELARTCVSFASILEGVELVHVSFFMAPYLKSQNFYLFGSASDSEE